MASGTRQRLTVTPLPAALGAVVEGLSLDCTDDDLHGALGEELRDAWAAHQVLFFPRLGLTPTDQLRLARVFGARLAATTETGGDYRNAPTLADEGFPELLRLDTAKGHRPAATAAWHTDVTFTEHPPIGSLFCMEVPAASGGDTMWSNQLRAYERLSEPVQRLIGELSAVHGMPPRTTTAVHPMVGRHDVTGRPYLYVNRLWTRSVDGLSPLESRHLLAMLFEHAEQPEFQVRWRWSAGDAALWDNRCTMHYALSDYGTEHRSARRATIYAG